MRILKKTLAIVEMIIIIVTIIFWDNKIYAQVAKPKENPVKVAVLLYRFDDAYISLVRQDLEDIQKKNEGKVEFTFYDGENDKPIQNKTIDALLESGGVDLFLLNLVDVKSSYEAINKIKAKNIPVILFNREPVNMNSVQSYNKAYFVGTNAAEAGILQGKILIDLWDKNKEAIDTNGDNVMQYIMLMGEQDNKEAIERTQYSILTIKDAEIQAEQLGLEVCDWRRELAKERFEEVFLYYGNSIEVIISNNDEMAIGAIEALQKYGYNKGDGTKTITVVGVDAIPAAKELIKKGEMAGSVLQDSAAMAEACYAIGMNLVNGRSPLYGTDYKFDETEVAVRIPYKEYI